MNEIGMAEIKLNESEIDAAVRVLRSGALRQGNECEQFEQEFANKVGAKHAVTCANGSAALHLAYMAAIGIGDEVLVPSFTFIATGSMATAVGAKPVFCDIDPETFLIDLDDAQTRITPNTKAIAPVHLFGNSCQVEKMQEFADKYNLLIIWDAAQAHGAKFQETDVGSFGDFTCYSFYPSKNMFVGEGGIICTNNSDYENLLKFMRTHGQTGKYLHTMFGLNYRMTDVEAAIGRQQLERLDTMIRIRSRNAGIYNREFESIEGIRPQKMTEGAQHAWHQYCITIDKGTFGLNRDELSVKLRNKGIASAVHYPRGLHQQPINVELYGKEVLPVTERLSENILALPVHHGLDEESVNKIVEVIRECKK